MTKNAVIFSVVVSQIFFLNTFTHICIAATQPPDTLETSEKPSTNPPITEPWHHYYKHDEASDGGKSMAFLRLGRSRRSSEDVQDKDENIRKEIDEALKSTVSKIEHNIAKRSNSPEDLDVEDVTQISDDQTNNGQDESGILGRFAFHTQSRFPHTLSSVSLIDSNEPQYKENHDEKEQVEFVPYEESDSENIESEEQDADLLDVKTLFPYSVRSLADFINKRNSFSLRPMKRNNFAFRPMKKNNFAFRPMKKSNFAFRPMKKSNFAFRPMKKNNFAFRPMKRNNFAFRPMKRNNFALRPMKRNGDSFTFRPFKKSGNNFALRPMKRGSQFSKDSFLRYGKRDSFALRPMKRSRTFEFRPMKRPEGSFVLRPMKKDSFIGSVVGDDAIPASIPEKKNSFSLRPMKKDTIGFQLRPMKRDSENYELLKSWQDGSPINPYQRLEDYNGIEAFVKRAMDNFSLRPM